MSRYPFILGITLLFWGWQAQAIAFALLLGGIIEVARIVPYRGDFKQADFERVSDIATILLIISLLYLYSSGNIRAIVVVIRWLPIILFPLVGLQILTRRDQINVRFFFRMIRTKKIRKLRSFYLDLTYPYFGITIFAASASASRNMGMYWGGTALIALFLAFHKGRHLKSALFITIVMGIIGAGFGGQVAAYYTFKNMLKNWGGKGRVDPLKSHTGIGQIGSLKFSDQIMFRVRSKTPLLLRETSYHHYFKGSWTVKKWRFDQLSAGGDDIIEWDFQKNPEPGTTEIEIYEPFDGKKQLLKLPIGTTKIINLPAKKLSRNRYGAVIAEEAPSMLRYRILYRYDRVDDHPPERSDLWVPKVERAGLDRVIQRYRLKNLPEKSVIPAIKQLFQNDYHYTLTQKTKGGGSALDHFLNTTRGGHCEYFASSTVLLLRRLGIPARYAVGYSVSEYNEFENRFLARERDAHAWVLAYVGGRWINLDTTPSTWQNFGSQDFTGKLGDFFSWLGFKFSLWQAELSIQEQAKPLLWLLFIILAIRMLWQGLKGRKKRTFSETIQIIGEVITLLEKQYQPRQPGETLLEWGGELIEQLPEQLYQRLQQLLASYYQYRYDPDGIDDQALKKLNRLTDHWLRAWRKYINEQKNKTD